MTGVLSSAIIGYTSMSLCLLDKSLHASDSQGYHCSGLRLGKKTPNE